MLYPQTNNCRLSRTLDGYWNYREDPDLVGDAGGWAKSLPSLGVLAVPASWNEQKNSLYHYHGRVWYSRTFSLARWELEGKRIMLHFSSVQYTARVFVNGDFVGESRMPYLPTVFDVTAFVHGGDNLLTLSVDGWPEASEPVGDGDFYRYGGINRSVSVCVLAQTAIASLDVSAHMDGTAEIRAVLDGQSEGLTLQARVGSTVCTLRDVGGVWQGVLKAEGVRPWTTEAPTLYTMHFDLMQGEEGIDHYDLKVGFRDVAVRGRSVLLNGEPIQLLGFGRHEDFCVLGKGMSYPLNVRDFDLMRWTGANSFRTSHYPYSEEMLDLADREGFLVISETPFVSLNERHFRDPAMCERAQEYLRQLIARDRNHPSVISFSVGNECQSDAATAEQFFLPLIKLAREMDSRPVTYVAWTKPEEDNVYAHADIIGLNRYYGWYGYENWAGSAKPGDLHTALIQMEECLCTFEQLYSAPLVVTEFGADAVAGLHSTFLLQFSEEFQSRFLNDYICLMKKHPSVAGMHVWNFADFATEQSPGRVMGNRKGVFTRAREPKQAAFTLRQLWHKEAGDGLYGRGSSLGAKAEDFKVPGM